MKNIILILTCILIFGCESDNNYIPTPLGFTIKFSGERGGFVYFPNSPNTETIKISDAITYSAYVNNLISYNITETFGENYDFTPIPNFILKDVYAIDYKCEGDLGQKIVIHAIIENETNIVVTYNKVQYFSGPTASGKPFILIEVAKSIKPVIFSEQ